jgi:transposase
VRTHAYDCCPTCAYPLHGQSVARRREVLDLPPPPPVRVIEYQVLKRYCPCCAQWREPALNLAGLVVGHGRMSVRVMALVAWCRTVLRLPVRQIQRYLQAVHGLAVSVGELCALLATVATEGAATQAAIKAELRAGPVLHMDETGWREAGQNGYVWVMTNPAGVSYFHYDHSRAGAVARQLSGAHYAGTLATDFYGGYNEHQCRHQRCWAHLIRDLAALEKEHGRVAGVVEWVRAVCQLYREGADYAGRAPPPSAADRAVAAVALEQRAHQLGLRWARVKDHPARALCQRVLRHEGELFEYVRQAEVAATNNAAERVLRPLVIARKISGGTRSATGSRTRMALQTLFTTWAAKGQDPLPACLAMLRAKTPLPSS